ncbi:MAG TPA: hypothetical protein DHW71_16525 [Gammaproteobacteria bacterium]|nr:hypothetical protein [Gammaproteobacteria bacterium]MEC8009535.1 DUF6756 family protein [Pseudomonadota bacterium]HCK94602.1 hypothetical protein [Gammaproteobacteria bacterium]|tara:strand:- start:379 stop:792 length:414 start_codon:yes stop_codon:yes gene_type:complete
MIRNWIESALSETKIDCIILKQDECNHFREKVKQKFANANREPLWEVLNECKSIYNPDGWKLIADFISNDSPILFCDVLNDQRMYIFNNMLELNIVLAECPGFTFYVTSKTLDYLFCFNDHDYLIGCGKACTFLEGL